MSDNIYSSDDGPHSLTSTILNDYDMINGPEEPSKQINTLTLNTIGVANNNTNTGSSISKDKTEQDMKTASPRTHFVRICPPVNCTEKIVICLDLNKEMETTCFRSRAGDKYSSLDLAKRAIKMFVMHKSQMNPAHEFALLIFHEESTMIHDFTSRPEDIFRTLEDNDITTETSGPLDLDHFYKTIQENVELPSLPDNPQVTPPSFSVRILMVYGRSQSVPIGQGKQAQRALEASPCFFTDVLYIHQPVGEDNLCEDIFNRLCELDPIGLSYILEASKYTPIFNEAAKLLAHPFQRPLQDKAAYKIGSVPVVHDPPDENIVNISSA